MAVALTASLLPGEGIASFFMRPYNFKVWAHPTTMLGYQWLRDTALKPIDLKLCLHNILHGKRAPAPKIPFKFLKVCAVVTFFS